MRSLTQYPQPDTDYNPIYGVIPVEFMIENLLEKGLEWFRANQEASNLVYGHLLRGSLANKYGQEKVDEIRKYINETRIEIMQSFPVNEEQSPSISINIANSLENVGEAGMDDFAGYIDDTDSLGNIVDRTEIGYLPIEDNILIGIHATGGPDKCRFLYMLIVYLLGAYKHELLEDTDGASNGVYNLTFSVTDLSRLNEYLPQNMFNRFVTVRAYSRGLYQKGKAPILKTIETHVDVE